MDKAIEIMKAAMEKEKVMNEKSKESMEQVIEEETKANVICDEVAVEEDEMLNENVDENVDENVEETIETAALEQGDEKTEKSNKSFFKNSKSKELAAKDQKLKSLRIAL